jgi:hypothetical protein
MIDQFFVMNGCILTFHFEVAGSNILVKVSKGTA